MRSSNAEWEVSRGSSSISRNVLLPPPPLSATMHIARLKGTLGQADGAAANTVPQLPPIPPPSLPRCCSCVTGSGLLQLLLLRPLRPPGTPAYLVGHRHHGQRAKEEHQRRRRASRVGRLPPRRPRARRSTSTASVLARYRSSSVLPACFVVPVWFCEAGRQVSAHMGWEMEGAGERFGNNVGPKAGAGVTARWAPL